MTQCSIDCDFQPAEREACQGPRGVPTRSAPGDPDEVLQIVSRHFAQIRELREVVQSWGEGCAEGSCQRTAALAAAALLIPANFCDSVKPLSPCSLDPEEFPVLGPVSPFDFATRGEVHSFYVFKPPVCSAAWPWEHFGTLSSARVLADWVACALDVCHAAIAASAQKPVELHFDAAAAAVVPQALQWLSDGGFFRDGFSFRSPVSPEFTS